MKSAANPFGTVTHALYSADKIDKRIGFYYVTKADSVLFKLYRSVADPEKALIGQFIGGKGAVSGAHDMGEVYDKPIAAVTLSTAIALFGDNGKTIQESVDKFNTVSELIDLLQPNISAKPV